MKKLLAIFLLSFFAHITGASAQLIAGFKETCDDYSFGNAADAPPDIRPFIEKSKIDGIRGQNLLTIRKCHYLPRDNTTYHILFGPTGERGVCAYSSSDVTSAYSDSKKYLDPNAPGTNQLPPITYIALGTDCPSLSSASYLRTAGVSRGLFKKLVERWKEISVSPELLEAAIDPASRGRIRPEIIDSLKTFIFRRASLDATSIGFGDGTGRDQTFDVGVWPAGSSGGWIIQFDFVGAELKIVWIGSIVA